MARFIIVHGICGNQIAVNADKIVNVTQGVNKAFTRVYIENDLEPIEVQERWQEIVHKLTHDPSISDKNVLENLLESFQDENEDEAIDR